MKSSTQLTRRHRSNPLTLSALSMGLVVSLYGMGATSSLHAQATTGSIFGQAPPGDTVLVKGSSGITRTVDVDTSGHYTLGSLPLGSYTVDLQKDGQTLDSRSDVSLRVGAGTEVSFSGTQNAQNLSAVTVQANALPTIDVTGVDSRTVITSQELARLPLARSAEAIALLAPGVVEGSGLFMMVKGSSTSTVSFGGSSVTENAYYINGFNTTDPLSGFGGLTLPYGAIDQQEILTGGYDAAYGRSDGGVISQVGKRGTNEWHFGGQIQWTPVSLQGDPRNFYYVNQPATPNPTKGGGNGSIRNYRNDNKSWTTTVDAYVGGPLIKDELFLFLAAEAERVEGHGGTQLPFGGVDAVTAPFDTHSRYDNPKWYGKLDWNITDSNILELTGASAKSEYAGTINDYDYVNHRDIGFNGYDTSLKSGSDLYSAKFTSYITDALTFSALYGKMRGTLYSNTPGYDPTYPFLLTPNLQNPALTGGTPILNSQTVQSLQNPAHATLNSNLRIDLSYKLGDHTITAGIDNQNVLDKDDGTIPSGPGYAWEYGNQPADSFITGGPLANGANWQSLPYIYPTGGYPGGATGYYVDKTIFSNNASVRTKQHAQYLQDSWQINDRWLVKVGLRNDQFTNYNQDAVPYLRLTSPQWAPGWVSAGT